MPYLFFRYKAVYLRTISPTMPSLAFLFTLFIALCVPFLAIWLERHPRVPGFFSSVVLCYIIGILLGNIVPQWVDVKLAEQLASGGMLIALPILLFGANIRANWKLAGSGLLAFMLCVLAGLVGTGLTAYFFRNTQPDGWQIAGMLTGLFTGGTPNMQAIGIALGAPADYVVLLQAADVLGGGAYLIMLMTFIHPFLGRFLPDFKVPEDIETAQTTDIVPLRGLGRVLPIAVSLVIVGIAAGLTKVLTGSLANATLLILLLTTVSLAVSLYPKVARMTNAYRQGEYFLLLFCVAIGLMANFRQMWLEGLPLLAFTLIALVLTIVLHWGLARLFNIDRDTVMISSTAAIYGPVFIAQITTAIGNNRLLAPGIALSLLGLAIGNYVGIGVAYLVAWLFG